MQFSLGRSWKFCPIKTQHDSDNKMRACIIAPVGNGCRLLVQISLVSLNDIKQMRKPCAQKLRPNTNAKQYSQRNHLQIRQQTTTCIARHNNLLYVIWMITTHTQQSTRRQRCAHRLSQLPTTKMNGRRFFFILTI